MVAVKGSIYGFAVARYTETRAYKLGSQIYHI